MKLKPGILFFLFFGLGSIKVAYSQQFAFQNISVSDGLAQSQVYTILEDSRGFMWFGTQGGGLDRYDGLQFKNYTEKDGLGDIFINALTEDIEGNIWIGTRSGLMKYNGWKFKKVKLGHRNPKVITLLKDEDGHIWAGTTDGIFKINRDTVINFTRENQLKPSQIFASFQDSKGTLWFGGENGVTKVSPIEIRHFDTSNGMPGNDVTAIVEDQHGVVWIGVSGHGFGSFKRNRFERIESKSYQYPKRIQCAKRGNDGEILVGTFDSGIYVWNPQDSIFKRFSEREGLAKKDVRAIEIDHYGNWWVGTSGGGISKYSGQQFIHFDKEKGLIEDFVYALCQDDYGRIWFSAYDEGLSIFNGRFFDHLGEDEDSLRFISKAIFKDRDGQIWIGTEQRGIALYRDNQYYFFRSSDEIPILYVRDFEQDTAGNIWVAMAGSGILKLTKDTTIRLGYSARRFTINDGLPSNRITNLHIDSLQRLWFSMRRQGVGYLSDDQFVEHFVSGDGLPSREVKVMAEDSTGYLWVGTPSGIAKAYLYGENLSFIEGENNEKLTWQNVYLIAFDKENNIWIGSQKGVERGILDKNRNILETKFFGQSEGFEGIETCQNAVIKDQEGNLWFGTMGGLTKYAHGNNTINPYPPKLHFTDVLLSYKSLRETEFAPFMENWGTIKPGLEFNHKQNDLIFNFVGLNLQNQGKVKYSWIIEGATEDWSPPSVQNEVLFTKLLPGDYTFKVKACNEDGVWTKEPLVARFSIQPPFWQTLWFKAAVLIFIIGLIGLVFKIRLNQIRRTARIERERLEMEKNLLLLEQKALQLQMNPHFIFNALNSIQSLISQKDNRTARYQLAKFSKLMRSILENSRSQAITLQKEIETLRSYLTLEQFSRGNSFQFEIEAPKGLDLEEMMIPPMIVQPFVENAIIHGVAHLKDQGQISIKFGEQENVLECEVKDNGIGRARAKELKSQQDHQHKSMALQVTQERLEILKSKENGAESLKIEDVLSENGEVQGTKVTIRLPIFG